MPDAQARHPSAAEIIAGLSPVNSYNVAISAGLLEEVAIYIIDHPALGSLAPLAGNTSLTEPAMERLIDEYRRGNPDAVRALNVLAGNRSVTEAIALELIGLGLDAPRTNLARNHARGVTERVMHAIIDVGGDDSPRALASRDDLPKSVLNALAASSNALVRIRLAQNTDVPPAILAVLSHDSDPEVRVALVYNRSTPAGVGKEILTKPDVVPFLYDSTLLTLAAAPDITADIAEALATLPTAKIRATLAENRGIPATAMRRLAGDDDPDVVRHLLVNPALTTSARWMASQRLPLDGRRRLEVYASIRGWSAGVAPDQKFVVDMPYDARSGSRPEQAMTARQIRDRIDAALSALSGEPADPREAYLGLVLLDIIGQSIGDRAPEAWTNSLAPLAPPAPRLALGAGGLV